MDQVKLVEAIEIALDELGLLFPALTPWGQTQVRMALADLMSIMAVYDTAARKAMS